MRRNIIELYNKKASDFEVFIRTKYEAKKKELEKYKEGEKEYKEVWLDLKRCNIAIDMLKEYSHKLIVAQIESQPHTGRGE